MFATKLTNSSHFLISHSVCNHILINEITILQDKRTVDYIESHFERNRNSLHTQNSIYCFTLHPSNRIGMSYHIPHKSSTIFSSHFKKLLTFSNLTHVRRPYKFVFFSRKKSKQTNKQWVGRGFCTHSFKPLSYVR